MASTLQICFLRLCKRNWSPHQQAAPPTLENHKRISYSHVCLQIDILSLEHTHIFPYKKSSPVTCTSQFVPWQWGWVENIPEVAAVNVPDVSSQTVAHVQNASTWNALVGLERKRKHVGAESAQVELSTAYATAATHRQNVATIAFWETLTTGCTWSQKIYIVCTCRYVSLYV